jgi:hypothetical protein
MVFAPARPRRRPREGGGVGDEAVSADDSVRARRRRRSDHVGCLVRYGFVVPFAVGAALATVGLALGYTQVEETVDPDDVEEVSPAPTD